MIPISYMHICIGVSVSLGNKQLIKFRVHENLLVLIFLSVDDPQIIRLGHSANYVPRVLAYIDN